MNKGQLEFMYELKKKSMIVAYLLWLVFGGVGGSYWYTKDYEIASVTVALLVAAWVFPPLIFLHFTMVMIGVVHTYFAVAKVNRKIKKEIEIVYGEDAQE